MQTKNSTVISTAVVALGAFGLGQITGHSAPRANAQGIPATLGRYQIVGDACGAFSDWKLFDTATGDIYQIADQATWKK